LRFGVPVNKEHIARVQIEGGPQARFGTPLMWNASGIDPLRYHPRNARSLRDQLSMDTSTASEVPSATNV
jgi:hypothetical protein